MTDRISDRLHRLRGRATGPPLDRLLRSISARLGSESGFAVPTVLMMLLAATAIVTVGLVGSIGVIAGTSRDQGTKSALGIAEGAADQALLHFNRIPAGPNPCAPVSGSGPDGSGWCPAVSGSFDGGTYSFQVRPLGTELEIVATGVKGEAQRRIHLHATSSSGLQVFANASVLSEDGIHLDANASIVSNVAAGGDVLLDSNASICGDVSHGVGHQLTLTGNSTHSCGVVQEAPLSLPPVNQGDAATNNDNSRLFALDQVSGNRDTACWNGVRANGSAGSCGSRELILSSNSAVTLGGAVYSFCKLQLANNSAVYIAPNAAVTIYFDSPESCGYGSGVAQLEMSSNTRISPTGGAPFNAALLFVGSPTLQTRVLMNSNTELPAVCQQNFVVYGPLTDVTLNSNSTYCGALAGKSLEFDSNAHVASSDDASNFQLPNTAAHYAVDRFVECRSAAANPPSSGC